MITLPISLAALIILVLLLGPVLCCITTVTTIRHPPAGQQLSRQFSQFRKELLARIVAAPTIDDHTRRLAQQLFVEGRYSQPQRTTCSDGGTQNG